MVIILYDAHYCWSTGIGNYFFFTFTQYHPKECYTRTSVCVCVYICTLKQRYCSCQTNEESVYYMYNHT